ncbi:hypothetical protein CDD81_5672 [Ophiocordyceps australis]|uniref:Radical SAM core domain-containing protein n=1 Tax=Ophiocordyceps australis TaxID=1399860 RepID=A0A2C5Y811_9HYPO|nr:hypothetical protein CDD81_5672 [Ophiocordyceps australis]
MHMFRQRAPGRRLSALLTWSPGLLARNRPCRYLTGRAAAQHVEPSRSGETTSHAMEPSRRDRIRNAKPFSDFLTDSFDRQHDYLRISVTERCNLRCLYCMPEEGVPLSPNKELLTTPEIILLSSLFVSEGVTKIRLTGGEPTVRRDILPLMRQIGSLRAHGLKELCLTTNGISLHRKLDDMIESGLTGINLSLDTLDPWQFQIMTRRKGFDAVQKSIDRVLELKKLGAQVRLKINCVVMRGMNHDQILPFIELTRFKDIEVRFIEYMPFDGNKWNKGKMFSYAEMLDLIRTKYPDVQKIQDDQNDTSKTWQVPEFAGKVGFITSMTHNFCGTCNRLRITSDGNLKVCLFGNAEVSLRDILRESNNGEPIEQEILQAVKWVEMQPQQEQNAQQPLIPNMSHLLNVIGMAVKRKKAKHAGIGELEHMKNRPMILIDTVSTLMTKSIPWILRRRVASLWPRWEQQCARLSTMRRQCRCYSTRQPKQAQQAVAQEQQQQQETGRQETASQARLSHVSESGAAHMVSIVEKQETARRAIAACTVYFSSDTALRLIRDNEMKKGDVLGVARVAGIMAAKRTAELIPLCHPLALSHVGVELTAAMERAAIEVRATVTCHGKTGVEMEALTAASTAALTVYDMCKAVDRKMRIEQLRVVFKDGGKSGRWEAE